MSDKHWLKSILLTFLGQMMVVGLFSLFFYQTKSEVAGLSAILGGLVYSVPTLLAGLFMNRVNNSSAMLVLAKAYLGTLYKLIVSICLFIYVFKNIPISIGVFLTAYMLSFVTQYALSYVLHESN